MVADSEGTSEAGIKDDAYGAATIRIKNSLLRLNESPGVFGDFVRYLMPYWWPMENKWLNFGLRFGFPEFFGKFIRKRSRTGSVNTNIMVEPQIFAHELRTPLENIKALLAYAVNQTTQVRQTEALCGLGKCTVELNSLELQISSIICRAAIEDRSLKRREDWFDVVDLFAALDRQFAAKSMEHPKITWNCFSVGQIPEQICFDCEMLHLLLANLVDQAFQVTNRGFINLSYSFNRGSLVINVHDSGRGLASRPQRRIGEYAIDSRAYALKFAEFLEVAVDFETKQDFGTKAVVRIPVESAPKQARAKSLNSRLRAVGRTEIDNRALKILVLDKDARRIDKLQEALSPDALRREDVELVTCKNSSEAIGWVEEDQFDLILIDYRTTSIDGFQFLRFLRDGTHLCDGAKSVLSLVDLAVPHAVKSEVESIVDIILNRHVTGNDVKGFLREVSLRCVG